MKFSHEEGHDPLYTQAGVSDPIQLHLTCVTRASRTDVSAEAERKRAEGKEWRWH